MPDTAQHLLGQLADGRFPLRKLLGVSPNSAVFLTSVTPARPSDPAPDAAIKLIPEDPATSDNRLARWRSVAVLAHPGILKILHSGRCIIGGSPCLYVVTEFADEDLGQLLPQRALTPDETRGMLGTVLAALDFLHETGLVHAGLKPSNIHAIGDILKLSPDRICPAGETASAWPLAAPYAAPEAILFPASDVWSLGITLCETLTKTLPVRDEASHFMLPDLPAPFPEVVRAALVDDPTLRATLDNVRSFLDPSFVSKRKLAPPTSVTAIAAGPADDSVHPEISSEQHAGAHGDPGSITETNEDAAYAYGGSDAADTASIIQEIESPHSANVSAAARAAQVTATQPNASETRIAAEQSRAAAAAAGSPAQTSQGATRTQIDPLPQIDPLSVPLSPVSPNAAAPAKGSRIPVTSLPQVNATIGNPRRVISPNPAPRSNKLFLASVVAVLVLTVAFLVPRYLRQSEPSSTSASNSTSAPATAAPDNSAASNPAISNSASPNANSSNSPSSSSPAPDKNSSLSASPSDTAPLSKSNSSAGKTPAASNKNSAASDAAPVTAAPTKKSTSADSSAAKSPSSSNLAIVNQVIPEVSAKARSTIRGNVRVNVRVQINPDGTVSTAALEGPASSQFFANAALKAARQWRFTPAPPNSSAPSTIIRFDFSQSSTNAYLP
jgi:TonB family protein